MLLAYANYFGPLPRGCEYKYNEIIRQLYGGVDLIGHSNYKLSVRNIVEQLFALKPDFVVIPGDAWPFWRYAQAAQIPYILIQHDVWSWRCGEQSENERQMIEGAKAVIFTSEDHVAWHKRLGHKLPPHEVIYLRPFRRDLDFEPLPKLPGKTLVYAGGLTRWEHHTGMYGYRSYHRIFEAFMDCGWEVHVYCPEILYDDRYSDYKAMGVHCHDPVSQSSLYRELSQYTAGLHGYNIEGVPRAAVDFCFGCRPNKTWEYLAAGIPTIGINSGNSGKIFNGKWGLVMPRRTKLRTWLKGIENRLPMITDAMRYAETIDQDIPKFRRLLDPILACAH